MINILLLIHNIGFGVSALVGIGLFFFLFLNGKRSTTSITLGLTFLAASIFIISHVIGVNVSDPILSRDILMFNLSLFFIGMFNVHSVLAFLGKAKARWYILAIIYISGLFMFFWLAFHPDLFLLPSVPKMYFPNYYNPGVLNWTRLAFMYGICITYMLVELFIAYRQQKEDPNKRKQIKFFIISLIGGYGIGSIPNFLVYNIPVDPLWGTVFLTFGGIPIIYSSLKYEFINIRIIAKQAFIYGIGVGCVGGLIMLFDYSNSLVRDNYPDFPFWIIPLISAIMVIFIAGLVWRRLRENDLLKYEFITTVTHKFRTPLTHIKWASENLSKSANLSGDDAAQIGYIESAGDKLVELTGLLMNVSGTEDSGYQYHMSRGDLTALVEEVATAVQEQSAIKKITVMRDTHLGAYAMFDESRMHFIVQTFIENAVHYTPEGGTILVSVHRIGKKILFSVKDSGIGIAKDELPRLFTKFYRGHQARLADTEGMGIGLYMSKEIILKHGGKIWAESEGAGKGSTFNFSLKAVDR